MGAIVDFKKCKSGEVPGAPQQPALNRARGKGSKLIKEWVSQLCHSGVVEQGLVIFISTW